jgi:hypothetical protein
MQAHEKRESYRRRYLKGRALRTFLAAADCIVPPEPDGPGGGTLIAAGIVDWSLDRLAPALRKRFSLFLTVVETAGIFFGGRPFSSNSRSAQVRQLAWMESGPVGLFRMGFFGLKNYVCMGYYTQDAVWARIGYDGPLLTDRPHPDPAVRALCRGEATVTT